MFTNIFDFNHKTILLILNLIIVIIILYGIKIFNFYYIHIAIVVSYRVLYANLISKMIYHGVIT